jgi:hypothetical protein
MKENHNTILLSLDHAQVSLMAPKEKESDRKVKEVNVGLE